MSLTEDTTVQPGYSTGRRSAWSSWFRVVLTLTAALAMALSLTGVAGAAPEDGGTGEAREMCDHRTLNFDPDGMACLGAFWVRDENGERVEKVVNPRYFVHDGLRKLMIPYSFDFGRQRRVALFDIDTPSRIPEQTDLVTWPPRSEVKVSRESIAFSPEGGYLFAPLAPEFSPGDETCGDIWSCYADPFRVGVLDVATLDDPDGNGTPGVEFTLPVEYRGMQPWGFTYSPEHHVLYVVTRQREVSADFTLDRSNAHWVGPVLHAIDMAKLTPAPGQDASEFEAEPDAAHLWSRRLDGCAKLMGKGHADLTDQGRSLYLPCIQGSFPQAPPGARHGVMFVDFNYDGRDPRHIASGDFENFGIEFYGFPSAPNHVRTDTALDRVRDRLAIAVQGEQPRHWIFDASDRGFIGTVGVFVDKDAASAFVPGTGRVYADAENPAESDLKRVYDTNQLPVEQGRNVVLSEAVRAGDPTSNIIYTTPALHMEDSSGVEPVGMVFADLTGDFPRTPTPDPDADTNDIDPSDAVSVTHTGAGSGYGARLRWVGGFAHATDRPPEELPFNAYCFLFSWNDDLDCYREGEWLAEQAGLSTDDRDSFFGMVGRNIAQSTLSGDQRSGAAHANAIGVSLGEPWWEDYATHVDEDRQLENEGEFQTSTCSDRGAGDESATNQDSAPGSQVVCEPKQEMAASAWSSDLQNGLSGIDVKVGYARSDFTTDLEPGSGIVSTSTSVARNVSVGLPQAGALHLGEVRTVAKTWAGGRPGTAGSEFTVTINNVRVEGPDGETQFACGWDTADVSTEQPDDADDRCDPTAIQAALSRFRASNIMLFSPRRDMREAMTGSPGGAQAGVQKAPIAFFNDKLTMGDERWELPGLRVIAYKDGERDSRFVLDLAAVRAEAKYLIGQSATAPPPPSDDGPIDLQPAGLEIELNDPDGQPLAGGEFAVHRDVLDDGLLDAADPLVDTNAGTCTTGEDGVGDCTFNELDPGGYVITQTAAPDGYAPAPDFPVTLTDGFTSTVAFTNLRGAADIKITLTDTADPPNPLPGAEFVAVHADAAEADADADGGLTPPDLSDLRDDGALQQHTFRCTTDEDGRCAMADVPLGPYTVRQTSAPDGYQPLGEDITFEFTEPGQVADLGLTNVTAADDGGTQLAGEGSATFDGGATGTGQAGLSSGPSASAPVRLDAGQTAPEPVVASQPNEQEQGLRRLVKLPAQGLGFLLRSPGEAAPFAAVWLLLGAPIYLLARRRSLNMTTTGQIS